MSTESNTSKQQDTHRVDDEEGTVDSKIKNRILKSRERIDDQEELLFAEALVNPEVPYRPVESLTVWSMAVRQFLRNIKPLLVSDNIERASYYWNEVELGTETLIPPDKGDYQFSLFANPELDDTYVKQQLGLPRSCDPPKSKTVSFTGLRSVLGRSDISHQWTVCVDASGPPPSHQYMTVENARPVPKYILENAVEAADSFLQGAGIGLKTEDGGQDIIRGFDQSGDEPKAELERAELEGEPGL